MRILELTIVPNTRKKKEFSQSLESLARILRDTCPSLTINESEEPFSIIVIIQWETMDQMQLTLRSEAFAILSGAISALCDSVIVRLDDQMIGNQFSDLDKLSIKDLSARS